MLARALTVAGRRGRESPLNLDDASVFDLPGTVGPFVVQHPIGSGVLGPVLRAVDPASGQPVALKLFRLDWPPEQAQALAGALQTLIDTLPLAPGIVRPLAAGLERSGAWLAQELVLGEGFDVSWRRRPPTAGRVVSLLRQVATALDTAAAAGWRHGALHPRDVLVDERGDARVTGIGVAQLVERFGARPPRRRPFAAPERLVGGAWDVRADVFSLAALAAEWFGARRGRGSPVDEVLSDCLDRAGFDGGAAGRVLAAALSSVRDERPASATALVDALERALRKDDRSTAGAVGRDRRPRPADAPQAAPPLLDIVATNDRSRPGEDGGDGHTGFVVSAPPDAMARTASRADGRDEADPGRAEASTSLDPGTVVLDRGSGGPDSLAAPDLPIRPIGADSTADVVASEPVEGTGPRAAIAPGAAGGDATVATEGPSGAGALASHEATGTDRPASGTAAPSPEAEPVERPAAEGDDGAPASELVLAAPSTPLAEAHRAARPRASARAMASWLPLLASLLAGVILGFWLGQWVATSPAVAPTAAGTAEVVPDRAEVSEAVVLEEPPAGPAAGGETPRESPGEDSGTAAGRQPATTRVTTRAEPPGVASTSPAPTATLHVRSVPPGARVRIGGIDRGLTPLEVTGLVPGRHRVEVSLTGHEAETRQVDLRADRPTSTLEVRLRQRAATGRPPPSGMPDRPATVDFVTRPAGARVFLNGRLLGTTPLTRVDVPAGTHVLRFELAGHAPWTTTITLAAGEARRVTASLEPGR